MTIDFGIQIDTETSYTNYEIGIVSGIIKWSTGRDYAAGWKYGFLLLDSLGKPSRHIDIEDSGNYGQFSGFKFGVTNESDSWKTLRDNGVYLKGKSITFYTVIDGVFSPVWTGAIDDEEISEIKWTISCVFKPAHKIIPPENVTKEYYSDAPDNIVGSPIPVQVGKIPNSKLLNVTGEIVPVQLGWLFGDITKKVYTVAGTVYTPSTTAYPTMDLYTPGDISGIGQAGLALNELATGEYFLMGVKNNDQTIRIVGNTATSGSGPSRKVRLTLAGPIQTTANADLDAATFLTNHALHYGSNQTTTVMYFRIVKIPVKYVIANGEIDSILRDSNGFIKTSVYDTDRNAYEDFSYLAGSLDTTTANRYNHPTLDIKSGNLDLAGQDVNILYPVIPSYTGVGTVLIDETITTVTDGTEVTWEFGSGGVIGEDKSELRDRSAASKLSVRRTGCTKLQLEFTTYIPTGSKVDFDKLFMGWDLAITSDHPFSIYTWCGQGPSGVLGQAGVGDCYDQNVLYPDFLVVKEPLSLANTMTTGDYNYLPREYYDGASVVNSESTRWATYDSSGASFKKLLEIPSNVVDSIVAAQASGRITVRVQFRMSASSDFTVTVKEIGFVGLKKIDLQNQDVYAHVKGEKVGGVWVESVPDVVKLLLKSYNGMEDADFDLGNTVTTRADWPVGRRIEDKKELTEYIRELLKHTMVGGYQKADGTLAFKSWLDDTTPIGTDDEETINRGSIGPLGKTDVSRVYNDFTFYYDWSEAKQEFNRSIFITNADQDSFPLIGTTVTGGTGLLWKTYVGGIEDYTTAKDLWDDCHAAYLKTGVINKYPEELSNLHWFIDQDTWESGTGTADNNSALKLVSEVVAWATEQKDVVTYSLPITADTISRELLDVVSFDWAPYTFGVPRVGWIHGVTINPQAAALEFEVTLSVE